MKLSAIHVTHKGTLIHLYYNWCGMPCREIIEGSKSKYMNNAKEARQIDYFSSKGTLDRQELSALYNHSELKILENTPK